MKYLVIGAGVLGSLVTHALCQGKNDVTLLARGERLSVLQKKGLQIYHIRQKKNTVDRINVVEHLKPNDPYDVIIVAAQNSQLPTILPMLCKNNYCKHIVLIGNNCDAYHTAAMIQSSRQSPVDVWFGFLHCGGSRKSGWVHNWHPDVCNFEIGSAGNGPTPPCELTDALSGTCLRVDERKNMDAWLKYHGAIIAPLCLAIQIENRQQKSLFSSYALRLSINAVKECMEFLKRQGYPLEAPHDMSLLHRSTRLIQFFLALLLPTKTGHYIAMDHALAAEEEISQLTQELITLASKHNAPLPCLKELYSLKISTGYVKH